MARFFLMAIASLNVSTNQAVRHPKPVAIVEPPMSIKPAGATPHPPLIGISPVQQRILLMQYISLSAARHKNEDHKNKKGKNIHFSTPYILYFQNDGSIQGQGQLFPLGLPGEYFFLHFFFLHLFTKELRKQFFPHNSAPFRLRVDFSYGD